MSKTGSRVTIIVDEEICKGCGLCVAVCPQQAMSQAEHINTRGFHPAVLRYPEKCVACAECALMCPDACMKILKRD